MLSGRESGLKGGPVGRTVLVAVAMCVCSGRGLEVKQLKNIGFLLSGGTDITVQPESSGVCGNFSPALLFFFFFFCKVSSFSLLLRGPQSKHLQRWEDPPEIRRGIKFKQQIREHRPNRNPYRPTTEVMKIINKKKKRVRFWCSPSWSATVSWWVIMISGPSIQNTLLHGQITQSFFHCSTGRAG